MRDHARTTRAYVVATGDELLRGFVDDANTGWLARQLRRAGIELLGAELCGDRQDLLEATLVRAAQAADLVVVCGGLGPTHDDRTAAAVAAVSGCELQFRDDVFARVKEQVDRLTRSRSAEAEVFTAGSRKQATLPERASALDPAGTAPGFVLEADGTVFAVLPGPPSEMRHAWRQVPDAPGARELFRGRSSSRERLVRLWGIREAVVAQRLEQVGHIDDETCTATLCARYGELELSVRGVDHERVDRLVESLRAELSEYAFAIDDERPTAELVAERLVSGELSIAVAESCSGGLLADALVAPAGASRYMRGGVVAYADDVKVAQLDVSPETLRREGAVSGAVAHQMAAGARARFDADLGVAVTCMAGPDASQPPPGTVFVAASTERSALERELTVGGDRDTVRRRASLAALHLALAVLDR